MTMFHIGCAGFAKPRERYLTRLNYVEFDLRAPTPSPKVFAAWKKHCPEGFTYGLVAPATLYGDPSWPLREAAKVTSELDRLANHIDALGASVIVFRTPMAVSPGSVALQRLAPVFERAKKVCPNVVWDPAGLWEHEAAVAHASKLGVIVTCDPLHDKVAGPVAYARMRGLGNDSRYNANRLTEIGESLATCQKAFVVFESSAAWREALGFTGISKGIDPSEMLDDEDKEEDEEDGDFEDENEDGDLEDEGDED
jgi:uncharacterized protein YecE (DUF72 family)